MGALTKAEMAERLYEELGLNKREAKELVELFFEEIRHALEDNEQVKLSGFGNFFPRFRVAARPLAFVPKIKIAETGQLDLFVVFKSVPDWGL